MWYGCDMEGMKPLSDVHAMLAKITREQHARNINTIVNHPDVKPWVQGAIEGDLDLSPAVIEPNVLLMGEHGGLLYKRHQPGLYEVHTSILKEGRGPWALLMARATLHWMFTRTDAMEIMTRIPKGNYPARVLAKACGFRFDFTNPRGWTKEGTVIPADIFGLRIQDWLMDAPGLVERGEWFYQTVLGAAGAPPDHIRPAGVACEMILGGQPDKAVIMYARWAAMADQQPIELVSRRPVAVDIGDRTIVVMRADGDFYVASTVRKTGTLH